MIIYTNPKINQSIFRPARILVFCSTWFIVNDYFWIFWKKFCVRNKVNRKIEVSNFRKFWLSSGFYQFSGVKSMNQYISINHPMINMLRNRWLKFENWFSTLIKDDLIYLAIYITVYQSWFLENFRNFCLEIHFCLWLRKTWSNFNK